MDYQEWKRKYVCEYDSKSYICYNEREFDMVETYITISEAHGYGMLLAVYNSDYKLFESLYDYYQSNLNYNGLLKWRQQVVDGKLTDNPKNATNSTDADMDIVYSLYLAWDKWQDTKHLDSANVGLKALERWCINIELGVPKLGDWSKDEFDLITRPSDFLLTHFHRFIKEGNMELWTRVLTTTRSIIVNLSKESKTGLISDYLVYTHLKKWEFPLTKILETDNDKDYYYNSCRLPWRLTDYFIQTNDTSIKQVLVKMSKFFGSKINSINVGYTLKGRKLESNLYDLAFTAPVKYMQETLKHDTSLELRFDNYFGDTIYQLTNSVCRYSLETDYRYNVLVRFKHLYTKESDGIKSREWLLYHAGTTINKGRMSSITFGDVYVGDYIKFTESNKLNSAYLLAPLTYSIVEFECTGKIEAYLWNPFTDKNSYLWITVVNGTKYTLDWHSSKVTLYVDGIKNFSVDNKDYHSQMFLIFSNKSETSKIIKLNIDTYLSQIT